VVIAPYVLALVFGLIVSLTIYFIVFWPRREPLDDDE
jgi:hypothetical protein